MIIAGTKRDTIEKYSLGYLLTKIYGRFFFKRYFKIRTNNKKVIDYDESIIYAINHQNALMDALGLLFILKGQIIFLARADIFQNPIVNKILTFLKIMPSFRIRDGKESLKNNDAIYLKTIDIIRNKNGLAILPEGSHGEHRRLKPLKKGIFRLAFQAEEENNFNLDIKIIPVGLDYSNYINFGSKLFLNIGEPIKLSDYYEEYKENAAKTLTNLSKRLSTDLKKVMIHIESEEFYEFQNEIARIYAPYMAKKMGLNKLHQPNQFNAEFKIIEHTNKFIEDKPEEAKEIQIQLLKYLDLLKNLKIRDWVIRKNKTNVISTFLKSILLVIFSPVFLFGLINNLFPYFAPVIVSKKIKDTQFISSVRYVVGMLVALLFYPIQSILVCTLIDGFIWWKIAYILTIPFFGIVAFEYFILAKKVIGKWRFMFMRLFKNKKLKETEIIYRDIISKMNSITG